MGAIDTSDATLASLLAADEMVRYALLCEARTCSRIDASNPIDRVLRQFEEMIDRFAAQGIDTAQQRAGGGKSPAAAGRWLAAGTSADISSASELFLDARLAKRRLLFRDPDLAPSKTSCSSSATPTSRRTTTA